MKTKTENLIICSKKGLPEKFTHTYQVKEDNAGNLYFLIYQENLETSVWLGLCSCVAPEDIRTCIRDIALWKTWEGLVNIYDLPENFLNGLTTVQETRIEHFGHKIRKLYYREGELFSYDTLIAKIDCKSRCLFLNARKYSQTTSRIQNELVSMAESRRFDIYYCPTETILGHL